MYVPIIDAEGTVGLVSSIELQPRQHVLIDTLDYDYVNDLSLTPIEATILNSNLESKSAFRRWVIAGEA